MLQGVTKMFLGFLVPSRLSCCFAIEVHTNKIETNSRYRKKVQTLLFNQHVNFCLHRLESASSSPPILLLSGYTTCRVNDTLETRLIPNVSHRAMEDDTQLFVLCKTPNLDCGWVCTNIASLR